MTRLPDNAKYVVPNNSDLFGNIWYTRNINLDEEGYLKLSPRMVKLTPDSEVNFGLPLAFGRINYISYNVVTSANPYKVDISETGATSTLDTATSAPTTTFDSHGRWYKNLWHVTDTDDLFFTNGSAFTEITDGTPANLTASKTHFIENFRNKSAISVTNGNTVNLYTESSGTYTLVSTLTLPSDYEVVGLAYSNYQMGIITVLDPDTASGQNQDAYFFVWDGAGSGTVEAGQGVPVGSDKVLGIVAYKGSWVLLTKAGQLLFWNGGGFQELTSLPFYYKDILFGSNSTRDLFGDIMTVDGDVIYINFNGLMRPYGARFETYLQNNPGGILCYDSKVGIYNKYTPSISPVSFLTVTSANVNTSTNVFTKTAGTIPSTGSPIKYTSDKTNQIGGIRVGKVYYCIKLSSTTFSLATTRDLAIAGTAIDITSTGASNNYFMALEVYDFGATLGANFGGVTVVGSENSVVSGVMSGSTLNDFASTNTDETLCFTVKGFENRGYFVTSKIKSENLQDTIQTIFQKIRPLKDGDIIVVKYKDKELVGLPVSTPQSSVSGTNQCIWTSANSFYTDCDLSDALTAFTASEELELEIISGAGAGTLTKIVDISQSGTRYVVVLEEDVIGCAAGRYSDVIIDNWKVYKTITNADTEGLAETGVGKTSTWAKFKCELRGTDVTIEENNIINTKHQ